MKDILAAVCLKAAKGAAARLKPKRTLLLRLFSILNRYKFSCRVELVTDESKPTGQDRFFDVLMTGRIPTPQDRYDTSVRIEIRDITAGRSAEMPVLSADDRYRTAQSAAFRLQAANGIVPHKNAILSGWASIGRIPCHILRFAYRGRRKLLCVVSILSAETGQVLTSAQRVIEYVSFRDGYQELRGRRVDVLGASVELAVIAAGGVPNDLTELLTAWFGHRAAMFIAEDEAKKIVESILARRAELTFQTSCQPILAFGENTDRFVAVELSLHAAALTSRITRAAFAVLAQIAALLDIPQSRFLALAQKILLSSGCHIEDSRQLLGISEQMDEAAFCKRLNEEYRKWNSRVTHPDAVIRRQADRMLTLIADLRSRRLQFCP